MRKYQEAIHHAAISDNIVQHEAETHKVDSTEAAMTNLPEVIKNLLWVLGREEARHLGVPDASCSHFRHGSREGALHTGLQTTSLSLQGESSLANGGGDSSIVVIGDEDPKTDPAPVK